MPRFISHAHDILGLCACDKETDKITEEAEGDRGFRWKLRSGKIMVLQQEK